ncbi:hypothetical protein AWB78_05321 [Caballeronia calidae]|uniref:Uncharacterized protein n=1 Tax=Caballeronia calidae TaxID=1777139 RepID=A0A158DLA2_9BURK|nr:hypothetical protein [Caballeronia calidae]SAK95253.1 hypothetical protein AWB78_05321 [Caballeronia calidae]
MALTSKDMANFDPALRQAYDKYVDNLMRGADKGEAAMRAGVSMNGWQEWVRGAETDPYVIQLMKERLEALNVHELWNDKLAVLTLRRIVENAVKSSDQLNAAKELNVLLNITEVDEAGRTRKVPTLEDLYPDSKPEGSDA